MSQECASAKNGVFPPAHSCTRMYSQPISSENADTVLRDKGFIAAQKADILRRAAEVSDPDSEWNSDEEKQKPTTLGFFDDEDEGGGGAGVNDGEASSESDSEKEGDGDEGETALELAWISDPKGMFTSLSAHN